MSAAVRSLTVTGPLPGHDEIANVLVLGTGAAGWVGDLLGAVAGPFMPVPLAVHKGFEPPSFVDASTLVVAISASGDSPEVLASAGICVEAGAKLFAITSGGQLGALADATESPTVFLPHAETATPVPPRARVGALAIPALKAFDTARACSPAAETGSPRPSPSSAPAATSSLVAGNAAEHLARSLAGTMPLVYGGGVLGGVAADRWKAQINQSAKSPAFVGELPDVVHGELAGLGPARRHHPPGPVAGAAAPRRGAAGGRPSSSTRSRCWTDEVMAGIHTVQAAGDGALAQLLDLAFFGDVVAAGAGRPLRDRSRAHGRHQPVARLRPRPSCRSSLSPCSSSPPASPTGAAGATTTAGARST